MKNNRKLIHIVFIVLTFLIMALLIWGVWSGILLDYKDTQEQMMDKMIDKIK